MLPAPPASCAGWWFSHLWRALSARQPATHGSWSLSYPESGEICARLSGAPARMETIVGSFRDGADRRTAARWERPGEDGMLHETRALWQPGEVIVRPLEWAHMRRPLDALGADAVPWPLRVRIAVRGWHHQPLERAEIDARDGVVPCPVVWGPPPGELRLPATELPCAIVAPDRRHPDAAPSIVLAGLTLPWHIDLDREAWAIWRRFAAGTLVEALGGLDGHCPRHGRDCPWPATGRTTIA